MNKRVALALVAALLMSVPASIGQGIPTDTGCATNQVVEQLGGESRWFCEPMNSAFFVQYEQFVDGLTYLDATYPDFIELKVIGESVGGLPVYFVEVTNEKSSVPRDEKIQLGYSSSIHANEPAGREGMTRMIEDLVAGIGPHGAALQPYLDSQIVNVWFPNPDSWHAGDFFSAEDIAGVHGGAGFARANLNGVDLNREFPSPGLIHKDHTPMSEPESQAVVTELRFSGDHSNLVAGVDLHGMLSSSNMIRSIIPNNDYDFRRMVLAVEMLRTTEDRVNTDPAFAEWATAASLTELIGEGAAVEVPVVGEQGLSKPMTWGARWDMIGYTDTGFTSDYLMMSPRSPTGGMGAVGTITEFAYSHQVPDNKFVPKLVDMHVAGVRQIVRTQMEMVGRLDTPVLSGTGPVAYAWVDDYVTSENDPLYYNSGNQFDVTDSSTWFDFEQVPYKVNNLLFWRDLDRYSADPIEPVLAETLTYRDLTDYEHLVITNQALDAMPESSVIAVKQWVEDGGHLLLTDSALRWFEEAGLGTAVASKSNVYLGHTDVQDWDSPLVANVDWSARVTGEGPAIGMQVGNYYPQWSLDQAWVAGRGGDVVGTTSGGASLGTIPFGDGSVDFLGGALPKPVQLHDGCTAEAPTACNSDHRYGLADYSVSAFTYWIVMNSLGGEIDWQAIDKPFVPFYDFDPLNGGDPIEAAADPYVALQETSNEAGKDTPSMGIVFVAGLMALAAVALRRRS